MFIYIFYCWKYNYLKKTNYLQVRNEFYKDAQAVMLVYDVTKSHTIDALDQWMNEVKTYITNPKDLERIIFIVFANKTDKNNRCVDHECGKRWAHKNGCLYFETSANTGDGVGKAFESMFAGIVEVIETGLRPKSTGLTLCESVFVLISNINCIVFS